MNDKTRKIDEAEKFIELQEKMKKIYADKIQNAKTKPPQTDKIALRE